MLSTAVTIFKAAGLAPVRYNKTTNKYRIAVNGYLITFAHIVVLVYCNYSHWWSKDDFIKGPVESRHQNTVSIIYLKYYWYMGMMTRIAFLSIAFTVIRPYLTLLNYLVAMQATWEMVGIDVPQRSWKFVASVFTLMTLCLFGPFVGEAYEKAVIRFDGWPSWDTLFVWNCNGLYMPPTTINFLVCVYFVKVNFDQICKVLRTRIQ
jgi:magnesium-transporting ATPase (P-type)